MSCTSAKADKAMAKSILFIEGWRVKLGVLERISNLPMALIWPSNTSAFKDVTRNTRWLPKILL